MFSHPWKVQKRRRGARRGIGSVQRGPAENAGCPDEAAGEDGRPRRGARIPADVKDGRGADVDCHDAVDAGYKTVAQDTASSPKAAPEI